jgi:hypothetical protein
MMRDAIDWAGAVAIIVAAGLVIVWTVLVTAFAVVGIFGEAF